MSALDAGGCDRVGLVGGLGIGMVELVVNFLCSMGSSLLSIMWLLARKI